METSFLVIFTFLYFLQRFVTSSNAMIMTSSNVTCIESERQSLLVFKQTLRDRYNFLSTWRGVECCEWHGVGCDSQTGHVVKLDLRAPDPMYSETLKLDRNIQLKGKLSHSLKNLKHLRYLDLSMNDFYGYIPKFLGSFKRLEYLNLSAAGFKGVVPHHLGNLSRLQYLDLRRTLVIRNTYFEHHTRSDMYGLAPTLNIMDDLIWVSSLSSLTYLDLSGISIGEHIDWFNPINALSSLLTLNLAWTDINIPSIEFVNFTSLNSLDLSFNSISTIPLWLSNLTDLTHLNLQASLLQGKVPEFFGMFSALASMKLSQNYFDTLIPEHLCNLSSLIHLDLSENMFSGYIPASLGLLSRLEDLYLHSNQLSGNIPLSLGKLSKLKNLDLSSNSLAGVLSETHFTMLNNLKSLVLSLNSLVLNFSSQWTPPFQLQVFYAASCNNGPHFPNWLQTQTNLQRIDIFNSSIRDTLPVWFENIFSHIFYMDLSNNQMGGRIPRIHFESSNQIDDGILDLSSNKFEGSIATFPSNMKFLDLSDNLLSGNVPKTDETMNPRLEVVNLSKNRLAGSIPLHLCKVLSITILDLSQNNFSGRLPGCLGKLINLHVIDLGYNTITGGVPSSLGSLKNLYSLHLQNNRFEGNIPMPLQKLTELETLDIGNNMFMGTIPFWIGKRLSKLKLLNLQSNKFTGEISLRLCQLKALRYLSLAQNNITGTIPHCFRNLRGMIMNSDDGISIINYEENILTSMKGRQLLYTKTIKFLTSLDLSNNKIVGEIPNSLMYLVGLKNLNLLGNLLEGQIPINIGDLKQLESLDMSMNKLSGQIPQSLTSLHFLSYLNLSFNNLSGPIPIGNQLQTLSDASIYEGNNGLCGPPVSRSCNGNGVPYNHVSEDEGQDDTVDVWFYIGIGPGFVVGFVGLVGSLHIFRSWRLAYFGTLEVVYGWLRKSILLNLARLRRKVVE